MDRCIHNMILQTSRGFEFARFIVVIVVNFLGRKKTIELAKSFGKVSAERKRQELKRNVNLNRSNRQKKLGRRNRRNVRYSGY